MIEAGFLFHQQVNQQRIDIVFDRVVDDELIQAAMSGGEFHVGQLQIGQRLVFGNVIKNLFDRPAIHKRLNGSIEGR